MVHIGHCDRVEASLHCPGNLLNELKSGMGQYSKDKSQGSVQLLEVNVKFGSKLPGVQSKQGIITKSGDQHPHYRNSSSREM